MRDLLQGEVQERADAFFFWFKVIGIPLGLLLLLIVFRFVFLFVVQPGYVGILTRAGKIGRRNLEPGWYFAIPIVTVGYKVYLGLQRIALDEETRTKDNAIVSVKGAGQFRVVQSQAEASVFQVDKPEAIIKDRLLSALRSAIGKRTAAECFEHKEQISAEIIEEVKAGLEALGYEIEQVPITEVAPHKDVVKAINEVQAAQRQTDVARAQADATTVRVKAEALAQAEASQLRGKGRAEELGAEALGYLEMIRTLTGQTDLKLDTKTAVNVIMWFQSMAMKSQFAKSGKASAVILPDDQTMLKEIAELVPALVSYEAIEGKEAEPLKTLTLQELEARFRAQHSGEDVDALVEAFKTQAGEELEQTIEKLPTSLKWLAKRISAKKVSS